MREFLMSHLPEAMPRIADHTTCLYTMTPDRDFVLDRLPEYPQITVGLGAAHGFKFSCLIGQILADLASVGDTRYPIAPFGLNRAALTDPSFVPAFNLTAAD